MESCKDLSGEEFEAGRGAGAGGCTGTALPLPLAFTDPMPRAWWVACWVGGGAPDCPLPQLGSDAGATIIPLARLLIRSQR